MYDIGSMVTIQRDLGEEYLECVDERGGYDRYAGDAIMFSLTRKVAT